MVYTSEMPNLLCKVIELVVSYGKKLFLDGGGLERNTDLEAFKALGENGICKNAAVTKKYAPPNVAPQT